jgi:hypothetical protein
VLQTVLVGNQQWISIGLPARLANALQGLFVANKKIKNRLQKN